LKTIWKETLSLSHEMQQLHIPTTAVVQHVAGQNGVVTLWFETDTGHAIAHSRRFRVIGTGWQVPEDGTYLGTAHLSGYVWHVYEVMS